MSVTELVDYGYIIVYIYIYIYIGHQIANFGLFLKKLELTIHKAQYKKSLICGDWNINFISDNIRIQEIKNLLESHNLINIVRSPTRISPSSESLIDVIVTKKDNPELGASVVDLGFSDHLAQVAKITAGKGNRRNKIVVRR